MLGDQCMALGAETKPLHKDLAGRHIEVWLFSSGFLNGVCYKKSVLWAIQPLHVHFISFACTIKKFQNLATIILYQNILKPHFGRQQAHQSLLKWMFSQSSIWECTSPIAWTAAMLAIMQTLDILPKTTAWGRNADLCANFFLAAQNFSGSPR